MPLHLGSPAYRVPRHGKHKPNRRAVYERQAAPGSDVADLPAGRCRSHHTFALEAQKKRRNRRGAAQADQRLVCHSR